MTADKITIDIEIERFDKNVGKINNKIREFVSHLKELCKVKNYNLIKLKMVKPNEK